MIKKTCLRAWNACLFFGNAHLSSATATVASDGLTDDLCSLIDSLNRFICNDAFGEASRRYLLQRLSRRSQPCHHSPLRLAVTAVHDPAIQARHRSARAPCGVRR
ncbi:hypothetical protein [Xanthomonas arboricola]|uniref:hypothetical protein n=1 Tax=Xanthomonas arboricola TaxID=56448 RepID=UPI001618C0C6|nr:hypothetical protein [Xanthomonas arboricola]MBB5674656.1 hypothetical protein [Xanthomonas arboricola]